MFASDFVRATQAILRAGVLIPVLGISALYLIDSFARALDTPQVYSSITLDTPSKLLVPDLVAGSMSEVVAALD